MASGASPPSPPDRAPSSFAGSRDDALEFSLRGIPMPKAQNRRAGRGAEKRLRDKWWAATAPRPQMSQCHASAGSGRLTCRKRRPKTVAKSLRDSVNDVDESTIESSTLSRSDTCDTGVQLTESRVTEGKERTDGGAGGRTSGQVIRARTHKHTGVDAASDGSP